MNDADPCQGCNVELNDDEEVYCAECASLRSEGDWEDRDYDHWKDDQMEKEWEKTHPNKELA